MNDGDSAGNRIARRTKRDLPAINHNLSRIRRIHAGQDFAERTFAGAVLSKQSMALTSADREGHVAERRNARKVLRDVLKLDHVGLYTSHVPNPASSRRAAATTGCGQDQTRKNIASRTARSAKCPETNPAPLEAAKSACVDRSASELARPRIDSGDNPGSPS